MIADSAKRSAWNGELRLLYAVFLFLTCCLAIQWTVASLAVGVLIGFSPLLVKRLWSFEVYLFVLILSLILEKYSYYVGFSIRLPMIIILLTLPYIFCRALVGCRLRLRITPVYVFFFILLSIYVLGTIWAIEPIRVIRVSILYLFLFALMFIAFELLNTEERIRKAIDYLIWVGILGAVYGFYQVIAFVFGLQANLPFVEYLEHSRYYNTGLTVFEFAGNIVPRINSTFNDPVLIGAFTGMSLVLLLSKLSSQYATMSLTRLKLMVLVVGAFLLFLCVGLTFSRSSWIGLVIGLGVLGYYLLKIKLTRKITVRIGLTTLMATVLISAISPSVVESFVGRFFQSFDPSHRSTSDHLKWILVAVDAWVQNPLFGVGLNNYGEFFAQNYLASSHAMTHSAYFSFLAETGLIGFLVELSLIGVLINYLSRAISKVKRIGDRKWYFRLIGLLSAYLVLLGCNLTYHFYTQFYVWFFMGLVLAASEFVLHKVKADEAAPNRDMKCE
ncbi:MAG: O-antigen ligase family protein [bacterium]